MILGSAAPRGGSAGTELPPSSLTPPNQARPLLLAATRLRGAAGAVTGGEEGLGALRPPRRGGGGDVLFVLGL